MNWIIVVALALYFLAMLARDGHHFEVFAGGYKMDASISVEGRRFRIEAEGDIDLAPDASGVSRIDDGGYLDVAERDSGSDRRVRFEGNDGTIERTFWIDGAEKPWNQDADAFVAEIVPVLLRETGISAKERVAWLLDNGGDDALVDEIGKIESDFVQQIYTVEYAESATIPDAAFVGLLSVIDDRMSADFSLRVTLTRLYETQRPTGASLVALIDAAATIDSDFEARLLLDAVNGAVLDTPDTIAAFFRVADSIDSDFELRLALGPVVSRRDVADELVRQAIDTAGREIGSDFELRLLLGQAATRLGSSDQLAQSYLSAAESIGSDFEARLALSTLADHADLSPSGWEMLLISAQKIDGDFECATLLASVAGRLPRDDGVRTAYQAALDTIDGDFERQRAAAAYGLTAL